MSVLRPKTIIFSAQSVRSLPASIGSDGTLILEQQTITDYDDDDDDVLECGITPKRRRLTFLSPEEKLVRRLVTLFVAWLILHEVLLGMAFAFMMNSCFRVGL